MESEQEPGGDGEGGAPDGAGAPELPDAAVLGALHVLDEPGPLGVVADEGQEAAPGSRQGTRWWARPLVVSSTAIAAIAVLTLATIAQSPSATGGAGATDGPEASTAPATTPAPSTAPSTSATSAPVTTPPAPRTTAPAVTSPPASHTPAPPGTAGTAKSPQQSLKQAIEKLDGSGTGSLSVAVSELDGGPSATYSSGDNGNGTFDTASIVKVNILAALLLQAQHAGSALTDHQRDLATAMIEASDNDAALALWHDIGGAAGLREANDTLGLRHTTGGSGDLWGLTQTTAADQLTLLRQVFTTHSALSAASRSYLKDLMGSVEDGQRWGVSAADSDDVDYSLKNGWLQRTTTGLWDINSIGEVRYEGHTLLISVLSEGQYSEAGGIDLVERAAQAAANALVAEAG